MEIVTREQAIELGLKKYFTGLPCKNGHIAERHAMNNMRVFCQKEQRARRYYADVEKAKADSRKWNSLNKGRKKETNAKLYQENCAQIKKRVSDYNKTNKDRISVRRKDKYSQLTADQVIERSELRRKKWEKNPEAREEYYKVAREYHRLNKDKIRAYRVNYNARLKEAEGDVTTEQILGRREQQKHRCFYCDKDCKDEFHIDHIFPLSKGGSNKIENIAITCVSCNLRKSARLPWVFLALIGREFQDAGG